LFSGISRLRYRRSLAAALCLVERGDPSSMPQRKNDGHQELEAWFFTQMKPNVDILVGLDGVRRGIHMNWFYWDTAWSLFFSLVWFMTITSHPDARIADANLRDEAFGG
jgi:hypothetical protein